MEQPGHVLIIDDELSLRLTLKRILEHAGCQTTDVVNGEQAIALLAHCPFDLVILDIHLPDKDGLQVLGDIRTRCPRLPVIMLTGHGSLESAVESLRLGAVDYLQKPIDPEIIVARVRILLDEQRLEKRKDEIRAQILVLEGELHELELASVAGGNALRPLPAAAERFFKRGNLVLDIQARRATFKDRVLMIPPASFGYLVVLAKYAPEAVEYRKLVIEAQEYQVATMEARELAKWHVHVLRNAMEDDPQNPRYLINIRGQGYRLVID